MPAISHISFWSQSFTISKLFNCFGRKRRSFRDIESARKLGRWLSRACRQISIRIRRLDHHHLTREDCQEGREAGYSHLRRVAQVRGPKYLHSLTLVNDRTDAGDATKHRTIAGSKSRFRQIPCANGAFELDIDLSSGFLKRCIAWTLMRSEIRGLCTNSRLRPKLSPIPSHNYKPYGVSSLWPIFD
jgi:hypothetical protein